MKQLKNNNEKSCGASNNMETKRILHYLTDGTFGEKGQLKVNQSGYYWIDLYSKDIKTFEDYKRRNTIECLNIEFIAKNRNSLIKESRYYLYGTDDYYYYNEEVNGLDFKSNIDKSLNNTKCLGWCIAQNVGQAKGLLIERHERHIEQFNSFFIQRKDLMIDSRRHWFGWVYENIMEETQVTRTVYNRYERY